MIFSLLYISNNKKNEIHYSHELCISWQVTTKINVASLILIKNEN
jgi:hypothetical protein